MRRLLILTCSARKREGSELLPAAERYDGSQWRVLRRIQRDQPCSIQDVDVYVLSAAFGLISASHPIPMYDQRMTPMCAQELHVDASRGFAELLHQNNYTHCCLGLSKLYLTALGSWPDYVPSSVEITVADGPMGEKLRQIKAWLLGSSIINTLPPVRLEAAAQPSGRATVAGVSIDYSRAHVYTIARAGIASGDEGLQRFRRWYVLVDGVPVAPKWLMSKLIDRAPHTFSAGDARRGLLALGIDIEYKAKPEI